MPLFQRAILCAGLALLCLTGVWPDVSVADDRYDQGVQAYQSQKYVEARNLLRTVVRATPTYVGPEGAAAYWLGRAYAACNQPDSSRWAWRQGVEAFRADNAFEARLFDAHLWASVEAGAVQQAARTYRGLLRRLGTVTDSQSTAVLRRHVAQLRPVLGEAGLRRLLTDGEDIGPPDEWTFAPDAGAWVLEWWQRQDPLPATDQNERIVEHLRRLGTARSNFTASDQVDRLDARGETYVRFGAPARRTSVPFTDFSFLQEVIRSGVPVDRSAFPANEIWTYPHIGDAGRYLFVEENGTYMLGTATDLLPGPLQGPFSSSDRSQNIAYSSQAAIRHIYEHLSMKYNDRGNVYDSVLGWFSFQESQQSVAGMRANLGRETAGRTIGYGSGARRVYRAPGGGAGWPSEAARNSVRNIRQQERAFVEVRRQSMPTAFSGVDTSVARVPIQVRATRFLDENGNTRTFLDWGGAALRDTLHRMGTFRVNLTAIQSGMTEGQAATDAQHAVTTLPERSPPAWSTQLSDAPADPYHVALQWDVYAGAGADSASVRGRQVQRIDTLRALSTDPSRLEMSDLRPMAVPAALDGEGSLLEKASPYPFSSVSSQTPLLLSFELYHLAYGPDDRTQYTVEYELTRKKDRGGFLGLFGGTKETRTATASTYEGGSRRTTEYILLDWGEEAPDEPQPVTVTVRVTDETTGQTIERTVEFRLLPPGESEDT